MGTFNWTCGFCQSPQTINNERFDEYSKGDIFVGEDGSDQKYFRYVKIGCQNTECNRVNITILQHRFFKDNWVLQAVHPIQPRSSGKEFPESVPRNLFSDYQEACLIKDLSPKASATMSRRCLQGIIRDFWEIREKTLAREIDGLKEKIDPAVWDAIDAVRQVGNIGAHFDEDVNLIVDIEPNEAQLLIELIEQLFDDWYIHREKRRSRLEAVKEMAKEKQTQKSNNQLK